ncbi:SDR family oxidoreductase [Candidatus Formimonas warabiya]|uniref:SDR family oxidoreductase n=1 Tax=Formimonas warabiya TaxID=1761012 RepID=UPI001BE4B05F|nr:SDR family NAD(P)-dependent oxidoreductase [Candidatus Formimonas warabiya]
MKNKVAIITGGAGGIGGAISALYAAEGAVVVANDINAEITEKFATDLSAKLNCTNIIPYAADVCNREQVNKMVQDVLDQFGHIDILVNCAGRSKDALLHKMSESDWDFVINLNLKGTFNCVQYVYPFMRQQNQGKIISLTSRARMGTIGQINYSSAKAGLVGLTCSLAKEAARFNINVNCISPGFVLTPRLSQMEEKHLEARVQLNPFERAVQPEDVANLALFLATEDSRNITGQVINIGAW